MSPFIRRACAVLLGAFFSLILAVSLISGEARADTFPGAIPARFSVSGQGAATYVIPIEAPAATGGIRPSLALSYNHLAGLGIAGVGWNLSGISAITRCSRTYAQDGLFAGYTYSGSADRYCLDGQRLVAYSGTYGASGTEYRTEIETLQRVFQQGTVGSTGAEAFYVKHGDGRVTYYGYTSDSRIEAVNISGVRAWYRSYTEDQFGNRINYVYSENSSTGEVLLTEVSWTSNVSQSLSSKYKIAITYETTPSDSQRTGHDTGGADLAATKRIDKIDVIYNGSTTISTYDLTYTTPSSTGTGRSQLASVTLCRGSDCMPPTTFTVQNGTRGWNSPYNTSKTGSTYTYVGDFDGDGKQDLFVSLNGTWQVYRGNASGSLENPIDSGVSSAAFPHFARVIDANGDGRDDLLYVKQVSGVNQQWLLTSTGTGFSDSAVGIPWGPKRVFDYSGDGLDDLVFVTSGLAYLNTGSGFTADGTQPVTLDWGA